MLLGGLENLHPDPRVRHFLDEAARDSLQRAVGGRDPGWTWILPWQRWADAKTYADASTYARGTDVSTFVSHTLVTTIRK